MAFPLLLEPGVYFRDDIQSSFLPNYISIGHTLRETGGLPPINLQTWIGGNFAAEFQYGIYNPVQLLLSVILAGFETSEAAAACLAIFYGAVLSSGTFALSRSLEVSTPLAWLAAFLAVSNNFVYFWYATSWTGMHASLALWIWWIYFALSANDGRWFFIGTALSTFLVATAGAPYTLLNILIFGSVLLILLIRLEGWRRCVLSSLGTLLGGLLALPAIVPLIAVGPIVSRGSELFNSGTLVPRLIDILNPSLPFHLGSMKWSGFHPMTQPIFYTGWFILGVIWLLDWKRLNWHGRSFQILLTCAVLSLFLTQGPEHLWSFRWPVRYLPILQIFFVVLLLKVATEVGFAKFDQLRRRGLIWSVGASILLSYMAAPQFGPIIAISALIFVGLTIWLVRSVQNNQEQFAGVGFVGCLFVFFITRALNPSNIELPDWQVEYTPQIAPANLWEVPRSWHFHASFPDGFEQTGIPIGQMGLVRGQPSVNGYSPLGHDAFEQRFKIRPPHGRVYETGAHALFDLNDDTGTTLADLMRISHIVAQSGPRFDQLSEIVDETWKLVVPGNGLRTYQRNLPNGELPGSISWLSPGLEIEPVNKSTSVRENFTVTGGSRADNLIVFSRLNWPGYDVFVDGKSVPVEALEGFLLAIRPDQLKEGSVVELTYEVPGQKVGFWVAIGALVALILTLVVWRKLTLSFPKSPSRQ